MARAVLAGLIGLLLAGGAATATAQRPPLKTALEGHWLTMSVDGSFTMEWSANVRDSCGEFFPADEFFNGRASETITFASPTAVRLYAFRVIWPERNHPPNTFLQLNRQFVRPGTHVFMDQIGGTRLRAPAFYTRSISGVYGSCDSTATKTLPPTSCSRLSVSGFRALVGWDPGPPAAQMGFDGAPPRQLYTDSSCRPLPDDFPEALASQHGLPNWQEELEALSLRCPPLSSFTHVRVGQRLVCKYSGSFHRFAGEHVTITLHVRGSR